jgi:hypothetical protein
MELKNATLVASGNSFVNTGTILGTKHIVLAKGSAALGTFVFLGLLLGFNHKRFAALCAKLITQSVLMPSFATYDTRSRNGRGIRLSITAASIRFKP